MGFRKRPSAAAMWTRCPASLRTIQGHANTSSSAANEGTHWHGIREDCLNLGFDALDFVGHTRVIDGEKFVFDEEAADFLQPGIDQIREQEGQLFVEYWVDTSEWVGLAEDGNRQGGTIDAAVVGPDRVFMSDLKAGRGVAVQAVENDQQLLYGLGLYEQVVKRIAPNCKEITFVIDQPRHAAGGGEWTISMERLLEYGVKFKAAAAACDSPNPEFVPGDKQCQWCPAANMPGRQGGCPAHAKWQLDQIEMDFEDLDEAAASGIPWAPPPVEGLTPERLVQISLAKSGLEKFLEYAHAKALQHIMDYGPTGGQKVVLGRRPPQKWRNADAAEAFMCQQLPSANPFNKKMKTPTQAAAEMGKKYEIPAALVERGQPKPIMVPVEDARPSIMTLESEFGEQD